MINEVEHDDENEMNMAIKSVGEDPRHWEGTTIIIYTSMMICFISMMFALTATQLLEKMIGGSLFVLSLSGWLAGIYYFIYHEEPESHPDLAIREYIKIIKWQYIFCKDIEGMPLPQHPMANKSD